MPTNVGGQTISVLFHSVANSSVWNKRQLNVRQTGIYTGGWLGVVNNTTASLTSLACEITDGTYQIRAATSLPVNVTVSSATPYIILRWAYAGAVTDYMEILAVASPNANDLIVGKCTFSGGGALNGFSYTERSNPDVHELYLKVEPTGETEMRVRVRGGYYQTPTGSIQIPDQKSSVITPPTSNSKIFLIYVDTDGTIAVDSSGVAAVTPVAPDYLGKLVLAEILVSAGATSIAASDITDVRPFITPVRPSVDGTSITFDSSGKLKRVDPYYLVMQSQGDQCSAVTTWTKLDLGMTCKISGVTIPADDTFTLPAGRTYNISYKLRLHAYNSDNLLYCEVRFRVLSGDTTWYLGNDTGLNVSYQRLISNLVNGATAEWPLTWSGIILPSVATTMQLEVITRSGSFISKVNGVSISVLSN